MPTMGECCGCLRAPVARYRFNIVVEDVAFRRTMTQLLCAECVVDLVPRLLGQSVEKTPKAELDDIRNVRAATV